MKNRAGISASTQQAMGLPRTALRGAGRVQVQAVACPDCGAEIGRACVSSTGQDMRSCHASRQRLATRKNLADRVVGSEHARSSGADPLDRGEGSKR